MCAPVAGSRRTTLASLNFHWLSGPAEQLRKRHFARDFPLHACSELLVIAAQDSFAGAVRAGRMNRCRCRPVVAELARPTRAETNCRRSLRRRWRAAVQNHQRQQTTRPKPRNATLKHVCSRRGEMFQRDAANAGGIIGVSGDALEKLSSCNTRPVPSPRRHGIVAI